MSSRPAAPRASARPRLRQVVLAAFALAALYALSGSRLILIFAAGAAIVGLSAVTRAPHGDTVPELDSRRELHVERPSRGEGAVSRVFALVGWPVVVTLSRGDGRPVGELTGVLAAGEPDERVSDTGDVLFFPVGDGGFWLAPNQLIDDAPIDTDGAVGIELVCDTSRIAVLATTTAQPASGAAREAAA